MTDFDVTYLGGDPMTRAARIAVLNNHGLHVSDDSGAPVVVLDAQEMSDAEADGLLADIAGPDTQVLVLFALSHGISFRARRDALMAQGAADVMETTANAEEFLTRVQTLKQAAHPPRILVVEDEDEIGDWAVAVLKDARMDAQRVSTLAEAHARFEAGPIDALVVDRGLPDGDGLSFIAQLRDLGISTPALLFTALDSIEERIRGLQTARADDYICKPVHEDELRARVQVLLRPFVVAETMVFGPLEISRKDRLVRWRGTRIDLRPKECDMLIYLAERADLMIPKRMIYLDVWQKTFMDVGSNPVTAARHRLVRDLKAALKERGEDYVDFLGTHGDAYVFRPELLLRLPAARDARA
ncbi:response regulator transcription factor [uncultured Tateyamaria sp.]|uniref:response regulator transcription factor n=1 Tax=Tateyamaria sp. TaxID=1929288 RepID=UPI00260C00C0|nr:response regulator transcription factor [uncultured Tateyamaria sp.]